MATNRVFADARKLSYAVPSGVSSGDPVMIGAMPGVALTDRDDEGFATVDHGGAYRLAVEATEGAIAVGDVLYFQSVGDPLDNDDGGDHFGYALQAVASGLEASIPVKLGY